jgi:hypothetical protein
MTHVRAARAGSPAVCATISGPCVSKIVSKNRVDGGGNQWTGEDCAFGRNSKIVEPWGRKTGGIA